MTKGIAVVDYGACMACGACVAFCPFGFFELTRLGKEANPKAYPELIAGHKCTGCAICAKACPVDCITME